MEGSARRPGDDQLASHGVNGHPDHPRDRPHGRSLAKHREDLDAFREGETVHAPTTMGFFQITSIIFWLIGLDPSRGHIGYVQDPRRYFPIHLLFDAINPNSMTALERVLPIGAFEVLSGKVLVLTKICQRSPLAAIMLNNGNVDVFRHSQTALTPFFRRPAMVCSTSANVSPRALAISAVSTRVLPSARTAWMWAYTALSSFF